MNYSTVSNEELDRIITEQVMGIQWHKELRSTTHSDDNDYECLCGRKGVPCFFQNPSPTTSWEDYGRVLVLVDLNKKRANKFYSWLYWQIIEQGEAEKRQVFPDEIRRIMMGIMHNSRKGCEAIAEFWGKEK